MHRGGGTYAGLHLLPGAKRGEASHPGLFTGTVKSSQRQRGPTGPQLLSVQCTSLLIGAGWRWGVGGACWETKEWRVKTEDERGEGGERTRSDLSCVCHAQDWEVRTLLISHYSSHGLITYCCIRPHNVTGCRCPHRERVMCCRLMHVLKDARH